MSDWNRLQGLPAFVPDPQGPLTSASLLEAVELPSMWLVLDAFEGAGYRRVPIDVVATTGRDGLQRAYAHEPLAMHRLRDRADPD